MPPRDTAGSAGIAGWLRLAIRSLVATGLLAGCLLAYPLGKLARGRNPVPRLLFAGLLPIVGVRVAVSGTRPRAPAILLANHVSWIDILALAAITGTAFVAHDGLAGHPLLRFLCRLNRTIFIARSDRASVAGQVDQVRAGLGQSGVLTIFPEGTTSDGTGLLPFKSSLLAAAEGNEAKVAIHPVWLDYGPRAAEIAWFDAEPGLQNVMRILSRAKPIELGVHLLPALGPDQSAGRKAIATAAREAVVERMSQRVAL